VSLNYLLEDSLQRDQQFALCDNPMVQLPDSYRVEGVVGDGLLDRIDLLGTTLYDLMENVVDPIRSTDAGRFSRSYRDSNT